MGISMSYFPNDKRKREKIQNKKQLNKTQRKSDLFQKKQNIHQYNINLQYRSIRQINQTIDQQTINQILKTQDQSNKKNQLNQILCYYKSQIKIPSLLFITFNVIAFLITSGLLIYQGIFLTLRFNFSITKYIDTTTTLGSSCNSSSNTYLMKKYTDIYVNKMIAISFVASGMQAILTLISAIIVIVILVRIITKKPSQIQIINVNNYIIKNHFTPCNLYLLFILNTTAILSISIYVGYFLAFIFQSSNCIQSFSMLINYFNFYIFLALAGSSFVFCICALIIILFWSDKMNRNRDEYDLNDNIIENTNNKKKNQNQKEIQIQINQFLQKGQHSTYMQKQNSSFQDNFFQQQQQQNMLSIPQNFYIRQIVCELCLKPKIDYMPFCYHKFHLQCIKNYNLSNKNLYCPICRRALNRQYILLC